jgi:hypothetical protein
MRKKRRDWLPDPLGGRDALARVGQAYAAAARRAARGVPAEAWARLNNTSGQSEG